MRIKITGAQSEMVRPLLADYPSASVSVSVLNVPDDDAAQVLDILREGHATSTAAVGFRRALAIVVRKLEESISTENTRRHLAGEPRIGAESVLPDAPVPGAESDSDGTNEAPDDEWAGTCSDCGTRLREDESPCHHCGTVITWENVETDLGGWHEPTGPLGGEADRQVGALVEMPERLAAVLRAIADGGYGSGARGVLRDNPRRDDERPTRYVARIRHLMYQADHDRAADALQYSPGGK